MANVKKDAEWLKMLKCRVAKNVKKCQVAEKVLKKYTHYLDYENYSQSVLSKFD